MEKVRFKTKADIPFLTPNMMREGRDIDKLLANGLNHPGEEGHRLVAELLWEKICSK